MAAVTTITMGGVTAVDGQACVAGAGPLVGLYQISAGWTYHTAATSDLWPGADPLSDGYIENDPTAVFPNFRIDSGGAGTTGAGAKYIASYWMRAVVVNATFPNMADLDSWRLYDFSDGGTQFFTAFSLRKRATGTAGYSGLCLATTIASGAGVATSVFGSTLAPAVPFNRWVKLAVWLKKGAAGTAEYGISINGQTIARIGSTADTVATFDVSGMSDFALDFMYAVFGNSLKDIKFQIGAMDSWSGTAYPDFSDAPSANTSRFTTPARYDLGFHWPVCWVDTSPQEGGNWAWTDTNGTPTRSLTSWSSSGTHPWRKRYKVLENTASDAGNLLTTRKIGTPPYSAETGWATLFHPMFMLHGTGTATVDIYANDNTTVLHEFAFAPTTVKYNNGATAADVVCQLRGADLRFALAIHLNSDGRAAATVFQLTDNSGGTAGYTSYSQVDTFALDNWTPAALGKVRVSFSVPAAGDYVEFDGMSVHRWLTVGGVDSYSQAQSETASPTMSTVHTRLPGLHACMLEAEAAACPAYFIPVNPLLPAWSFAQSVGWSGNRLIEFSKRNGSAMRAMPGTRLVIFGGIANDLALATSAAAAQSNATLWANDIVRIAQGMVSSDSALTFVTPTFGSQSNFTLTNARAMFDAGISQAIVGLGTFNQRGLVHIHQTTGLTYVGSDGIHPDDTQSGSWLTEVSNGLMAMPYIKRKRLPQ